MAFCPKCQRPFPGQAGYCPFDGAELVGGAGIPDSVTIAENDSVADHGQLAVGDESAVVAISAMESSANAVKLFAEAKDSVHRGLIGKTLDGRYRIESVLGEGGMGIVFLARHVVIEKLVAVKVLKKKASKRGSVAERFVREAKAASRIGHPNIIDVTDFGTTKNGITYSVMEYVEGATLAEVIRFESPLAVERMLRIAAQMARALVAAHRKGVVHRDLKPDNVFLVDRDGRPDFVKIVDFGIARVLPIPGDSNVARLTRAGTVFGTPEYMAPEQASGRTDTDHRVDIYSLATIMYEMLTGRVPHKGDSTIRTLAMQMLDPIPALRDLEITADLEPAVEAIVMRGLEKKREDRYQDMSEMLQAILALTDDSETVQLGALPKELSHSSPLGVSTDDRPTEVDLDNSFSSIDPISDVETVITESRGITTSPTEIYQPLPKGEPAFVRRSRRPSIDDLFDDESIAENDSSASRWLVPLLLAGGALAVLAVIIWKLASGSGVNDRATMPLDASVMVTTHANSTESQVTEDYAPNQADGGITLGNDAGVGSASKTPFVNLSQPPSDQTPNVKATNGATTTTNNNQPPDTSPVRLGQPVDVEIITRPKGGAVWENGDYTGPDGIVIRRPSGTKARYRCKKRGFKTRRIRVTFGPRPKTIICQMTPIIKCVPGLKNPYGACK